MAPLITGGLIYLCLRSDTPQFVNWFQLGDLRETLHISPFSSRPGFLTSFLLFNIPDGLWAYSFSFSYAWLIANPSRPTMYTLLVPFGCSSFFELGQLTEFIPGTFDILDLLLIAGCSYLGWRTERDLSKPYK